MLSLLLPAAVSAVPADTLRRFDIEEAVVVASPKETARLRSQPVAVSLFDGRALKWRGASSLKDLSAAAPSLYMPDYGSRLTSAVYVRGVGSRINTPAVGLYVDNIPYADKTSYDFSFLGVERVDVLRGPQGTLYGRNTMGGLVRVFTADPLTHSGTEVSAGFTTRTAGRRAALTTYLHPTRNSALSLGGHYEGQNGFWRNATTGHKQDASDAGGGRLRWAWNASPRVRLDWTASYEYSDEAACPYFVLGTEDGTAGKDAGKIAQNRPSSYRRSVFNTGIGVEHRLPRVTLTSTTAYQALSDRLFMDQDFTSADIFSLCQQQRIHTVSEEIALKSKAGRDRRWVWTTGAYVMYQHLRTTCPVTFYTEGVDYLNAQMSAGMANSPARVAFTGAEIPFASRFRTPTANAAVFHQSTLRLLPALELTLGLRVDYDHHSLDLNAGTESGAVPYSVRVAMGSAMAYDTELSAAPALAGKHRHDTWQTLPKAALSYTLPRGLGNVYASVAKGYRSGGYNIQAYSQLAQNALRRDMMEGIKDYCTEQINANPHIPQASKDKAVAGMTAVLDRLTPDAPTADELWYKPEYTWSYEAGIHHNLVGKALQLDLAGFLMRTRDQQLSQFATATGFGRNVVNAGKSRSAGIEASVRSQLLSDRLNLSASFGWTDAKFTSYEATASTGETISYRGKRVPFVPQHTFSASADFRQPLSGGFLRAFSVGADVKGAGRVMWDEANTHSQPFYALLGARLEAELAGGVSVCLWGRNLTATRYATFSFESLSQRFAQYGSPRRFGADVRWRF